MGSEIVLAPGISRRGAAFLLLQIVAFGMIERASFPLLNPLSVFSDVYFDWSGIRIIAISGRIPQSLGYFAYFPAFHVLNAVLVDIVGADIFTYFLLNNLLLVLAIPLAYLVASKFISRDAALISSLLLALSVFFFLQAAVLPVLLGATIIIASFGALLTFHQIPSRRFWLIFWLASIFVFFSHPVDALVLAVILSVFWLSRSRTALSSRPKGVTPAISYLVGYLGYLSFVAVSAFKILVASLFESGPKYYFAQSYPGPYPSEFVLQALFSTLGTAALFGPAIFALFYWFHQGNWAQRYLAWIASALVAIPGVITLSGRGPYGLQAARTLLFLSLFLVFPAAYGLIRLTMVLGRTYTKVAVLGIVLFMVSFSCTTSYITGSGYREVSDSVPIQPTHVTNSMLAVRSFLERIPQLSPLSMDPALGTFISPAGSGLGYFVTPFPIHHDAIVPFDLALGNSSSGLALSSEYLSNLGYRSAQLAGIESAYLIRAYDDGGVTVYLPPTSG
jgi:hypothetical protein